MIFLFFTILTMLWCFPGLGMADKSCSEHISGTMGDTGSIIVNGDASGSFWESLKGLEFPM